MLKVVPLLLRDAESSLIWSSSSRQPIRNVSPLDLLLDNGNLDNGNLVVWDNDENLISFDYPGDTLLPGVKFGKELVTGIDRRLRSWKSFDDPSSGLYMTWMDTNGFPQIFETKGSDLHSRFGPWDGMKLTGVKLPDTRRSWYSMSMMLEECEMACRKNFSCTTYANFSGK
ncbi:hypothetical protein L6452_01950 [Arctium lappa]|uniref:Uncharacterized protein n=1 Tax=Arctium lappa TaxID=4217 RepID=A0ACB9FIZ1_ARCLA|nr:hypothetical protein L6452_01950 [Arctium lappa]